MQTDCRSDQLTFEGLGGRRVVAQFDAGRTSSDGGVLLLRYVAERTGWLDRFAGCFRDGREAHRVEHPVATLVKQRVAQVIHRIAEPRVDNKGMNKNARLFGYMAKAEPKLLPGSPATEIVPEVRLHESDVVLSRQHGLSPFSGTELDFLLRNLDVTTVVAVCVSVNVAITNLTFDCVNAGYQVVLPIDAVAGTPRSYVEQVFEHTLCNVATLVTTDDLVRMWSAAATANP